ncbi:hypothetical protein D1822_16590 [Phaeobacter inhibens]|uniref:TniQ family protein n=1 Tax=Phaeobacter inhibens TaxID=221822 RepID=UPI0001633339|nr:TniQ family protein [Phaeobacter inhibens]AFO93008.1 hypothetical protein PGA1_c33700 [Phaeobacter inhibens DSM 17395]AUQ47709.1 hypothetical protein PhaeoP10_03416 [Phaeobacter inhibens]AXT24291.1 hypothetical protein D1822_16590 [Phaeobacter inhibens]
MEFRGEAVVSRAVVNPVVRGCPRCLREDTKLSQFEPTDGMIVRGDWQFRHVEVCIRHASPLVPLWTATRLAERYDYATQLKKIEDGLILEKFNGPECAVTDYDRWIDRRLETGCDNTWLSDHAIDVAAQFCNLLGAELASRNLAEQFDTSCKAPRSVGFEVASRGPEAITDAMRLLADHATGAHDEMRKAYGRLYNWLAHTALGDPRYDPFRNLLRDVALDIWPFPEGTNLLGTTLPQRRLHSVLTTAAEAKVSPARMRSLLVAEGLVDARDDRPDARVTLPSEEIDPLLDVFGRLVGARKMQNQLGCGEQQFEALVDAGILSPRIPPEATRRPWDPHDGEAFINSIRDRADNISTDTKDWEHVHRAALRCRVSIDEVIAPILGGKLEVGLKPDLHGYASLFVRKSDVDKFVRPRRPSHLTLSEFATQVALNKHREFRRLADAGHTPVTLLYNPQTLREDRYVTEEDAAAFHARFTTLKLLSAKLDLSSRAISHRLKRAGIVRFQPNDFDFGPVFLSKDVEQVLSLEEYP